MCLLPAVGGWIFLAGTVTTRLLGGGLRYGREGVWKRILETLISKGYSIGNLSLDRVAVGSMTAEARKGGAHRLRWIQASGGIEDSCGGLREDLAAERGLEGSMIANASYM